MFGRYDRRKHEALEQQRLKFARTVASLQTQLELHVDELGYAKRQIDVLTRALFDDSLRATLAARVKAEPEESGATTSGVVQPPTLPPALNSVTATGRTTSTASDSTPDTTSEHITTTRDVDGRFSPIQ